MIGLHTLKEFSVFPLTADLAEKHVDQICALLKQIPLVDPHTPEQVLATHKAERVFHAKWQHSLVAFDEKGELAGVLMSYERESEGNEQYPYNCLYLSEFAISAAHQRKGLGRYLLQLWLEQSKKNGFLKLTGPLRFAIQTNQDAWNAHVQKLYESFGFQKISTKSYGNRVDNVYLLEV